MRVPRQRYLQRNYTLTEMGLLALHAKANPKTTRTIGRAITAPFRWLWNGTRNWLERRAAKKMGGSIMS